MMSDSTPLARAAILTISDGVAGGTRSDGSGDAVAEFLVRGGFAVAARAVVPDERAEIQAALRRLATEVELLVTTGGTGLGPRDKTPESTRAVIDREAPGLAEVMRAAGVIHTPMAALSRGVAGTIGGTLVINLPGSPRGAIESLEAVMPVLPHALELMAGHTAHAPSQGETATRQREALVVATAVRVHGQPPCKVGQKLLLRATGPVAGTLGCAEFDAAAAADFPEVLAGGDPVIRTYDHELGSVEVYLEPRARRPILVVLGATPVALWLLQWGQDLGYETALVDSRPERVTPELSTAAGQVLASPDDLDLDGQVFDAIHTDHDAPLVAEHLASLLGREPRFIGVMGSARHAAPHLDALRALGVPDDKVRSVHSPVGLDLGARNPEGIALSILAGLVAQASDRAGGWLDRHS